jgi:hypothetical protein
MRVAGGKLIGRLTLGHIKPAAPFVASPREQTEPDFRNFSDERLFIRPASSQVRFRGNAGAWIEVAEKGKADERGLPKSLRVQGGVGPVGRIYIRGCYLTFFIPLP